MEVKVDILLWRKCIPFLILFPHYGHCDLNQDSEKFSRTLFATVFKTQGNLIFSPISTRSLLDLAKAGAAGKTAEQLGKIAEIYRTQKFKTRLGSPLDMTPILANAVFVNKKFIIKPQYEKYVKDEYDAEVEKIDFSATNKASEEINAWVDKKSHGKIGELFEEGALNPTTMLVLLNVIYFKGVWDQKFPKEGTKLGKFRLNSKETKDVEFMKISADLRAIDGPEAQIVELPYEGPNVSMVLVIPKKLGTLPALEAKFMDLELLPHETIKYIPPVEIVLKIPKFKINYTLQLKDTLKEMGITDLFSSEFADLSGISDEPIFVTDAIQKAAIEIDEEGSEAAAASDLTSIFWVVFFIMAAVGSTDITQQLAESNAKFTSSMFNIIRGKPGNLFFSPICVEAVLALAHAGAGGSTAAQIQAAAHLPETREVSAQAFGQLIDLLKSDEQVTLNLANALYADSKFKIKPDYLGLVEKDFKAELGQVEFAKSSEATNTINSWVAGKTNNKIPQLFNEGTLDASTKLVLLSAIYFKGNWDKQFPASATKKRTFHLNEKETKEVDFMSLKAHFRINEEHGAYFIELPYKGNSVSMVIASPKAVGGLDALETQLLDSDLSQIIKDGRKREVELSMPKFKLEQTLELNEILMKLGITDLFSDKDANLSGISDLPLVVSKVIHKAFVEVNEEGSEAAAATGMKVMMRMMPAPPKIIIIDAPFLFFIRANEMTLFAGRVAKPTYN